MDTSLTRRYRDARPVHSAAGARLDLAHDVVADAAVWLLRAAGLAADDAAIALAMRARALHDVELTQLDPGEWSIEADGNDVVVALAPFGGETWTAVHARADGPRQATMARQLGDALAALAARGVPLAPIDPLALIETDEGPRLLPSAWLVPPAPADGSAVVRWGSGAGQEAIHDLVATLARRGVDALDVEEARPVAVGPPDVLAAVASMDEGGALVVHPTAATGPYALGAAIRRDAEARGSQVLELVPDHRLVIPERRHGVPGLVMIVGARNYADVAVTVEELSGSTWLDGHERLVWVVADGRRDPVLDLFLDARYGPLRHSVIAPEGSPPPRPEATGHARFVLDALAVAGAALPVVLLQQLSRVPSEEFASLLVERWKAGNLDIVTGSHVTATHRQTAVASWPADVLDPDRTRELQLLFADALEGASTRRVASAWWRGRLLARCGAVDAAVRQLRDVAQRAKDRGMNLLALSAFDRIGDLGGPATLDDVIRGATLRAETMQRTGALDAAQQTLEAALALVTEQPDAADPSVWADLVFRAVQLDFHRSDFASAEARLQDLLERARNELPTQPRSLAYGELAWAQLHRGRTGEAVRTAELALRRLDPLQHGALVARLHNLVGFALYKQSDYSQSLVHYDRALRLREQLGDDMGVARTQNNMALSHMALGQVAEAEATLLDSIRRKRAGDDLSIAASLINLGVVRLEKADHAGTEEVAEQALEIAGLRHHPETEAEAWGLLGDVALAREDAPRALELFERNLAICEANGHDTERLATLRRLGATLLALGRDDDAAERLEAARKLLEAQPSRYEAARIDALEAEILARAGSLPLAIESLARAARGFALVGRHTHQAEVLVRRGELEQALGREARVRATLVEVRDVLARHEIHRPPQGIDRLERMVREQPARDEPLTAEACLALLVEALDHPVEGMGEAAGPATALGTALGARDVLLIDEDGEASLARSQGWEAASLPAALADRAGDRDGFERRGPFDVHVFADGRRCLALRREIPLRGHERELVRGLVRLWVEARPRGTESVVVGPGVVAPPVERDARKFGLIGRSEGMRRVVQWIERVADTDLAVLVLGPNGSGKELVARALHEAGARASGPFVAINCASIPASLLESELFGHERGAFTSAHAQRIGRFEQARGGTLFLDEIGEMPADMQAKLLRVLQERTFTRVGGSEQLSSDARIVAATNRDLEAEVERGSFRVDLYYRLNVVTIDVPPLRDRLDDVDPLVRHFVARDSAEYRGMTVAIDDDVFEHLRHHVWPGNVRELENAVRNALVFGRDDVLRAEDFPLSGEAGATDDPIDAAVRAIVDDGRWSPDRPILPRLELMIAHALVEKVGNKTLAARLLGITKPTLYDRLRRHDALFGATERGER